MGTVGGYTVAVRLVLGVCWRCVAIVWFPGVLDGAVSWLGMPGIILGMSASSERFEVVRPKGGTPAEAWEPSIAQISMVPDGLVPRRPPSANPGIPTRNRDRIVSEEPEGDARLGELAEAGREGITDSLKAFGELVLNHLADMTHIGPVVRLLEFGIKLGHWLQSDGVVVSIPVPLGDGVDFQVSAHFTGSHDERGLPLTACISPSGFLPAGDIEVGGFELEPSGKDEKPASESEDLAFGQRPGRVLQAERRSGLGVGHRPSVDITEPESPGSFYSSGHGGRVVVVQLDLSEARQQEETAAAAKRAVEQELVRLRPQLWAAGVEFVVIYDPAVAKMVWLRVRSNSWPAVAWRIEIEVAPATSCIVNLRVRRKG
jgi:hypothetical protein